MAALVARVALAALAVLAVAAAPAAAGWSPPRELSAATDGEHELVLGDNPRGDAALAWTGEGGLRVATAPAGRDFAPPARIAAPYVDQIAGVVLGLRSAAPAIAWLGDPRECGELTCVHAFTARCRATSCPAAPTRITSRAFFGINPAFAVGPGGRALVSWEAIERIRGSLARRGRFGSVRTLPGSGYLGGDTFAFGRRGGGELLWSDGRRVRLARLRRDGRFARARTVGGTPGLNGSLGARIEGDPDRGHVLWWASGERAIHLNLATLRPGRRFAGDRRLWSLGDPRDHAFPALDVSRSGAAVLAWAPGGGLRGEVHAVVRRPGGRFGARRVIAAGDGRVTHVSAAVAADGRAVVAWRAGETSGPTDLRAATLGPRPGPADTLATAGAGLAPQVTIDPKGRGWAAWIDGGRVLVSRLTP